MCIRDSGYAFRQYYATEKGRRVVDGTLLKVPILGNILRKIAVARFCRTLSTLMASGVPILDGLDISEAQLSELLTVDADALRAELPQVEEHLARFEQLPAEVRAQFEQLQQKLA